MKKTLLNTFVVTLTLALLFFEVHLLTKAQDAPQDPGAPAPSQAAAEDCATRVKSYMATEQVAFGEFITQHFRSNLPTTELVPAAVERLRLYKRNVDLEVNRVVLVKGKSLELNQDQKAACVKAANEDMALMKELLHQHVLTNAYAKKTTRLLDKYKQINDRLSGLNFTMAQMYGYFGTFSQKIPCYASKCVKG